MKNPQQHAERWLRQAEHDQYYIPTRYPDALAEPAVPFESYTGEQATRALAFAKDVLSLVKQRIG